MLSTLFVNETVGSFALGDVAFCSVTMIVALVLTFGEVGSISEIEVCVIKTGCWDVSAILMLVVEIVELSAIIVS